MKSAHFTDPQLEWSEGLSVGEAKIDHEHRKLIERINDVNAALVAEADKDEVLRLMRRLRDTATAHFANEERLLRERGYPEVGRLHLVHERLIADFYSAMDGFANTPFNAYWLVQGLTISHGLLEHLAREDMQYRDHFLANGG